MDKYLVEFKEMFKRWNDFSGKSNLREYWMPVLINVIVTAILQALAQASSYFNVLSGLYGLLIIVPFIAVAIRRMHDVGKSGKYLFWMFLPFIGWILVIIQLVKPSQV
ncbi:MAG: DUF805 domain-containing protein [Bacillus subtilis]|nr:DUF805 domain-containing protein [Bacillus subtilis]